MRFLCCYSFYALVLYTPPKELSMKIGQVNKNAETTRDHISMKIYICFERGQFYFLDSSKLEFIIILLIFKTGRVGIVIIEPYHLIREISTSLNNILTDI